MLLALNSNVIPIGDGPVTARRALFLERLAAAFDGFAEHVGAEPEAMVMVLCGLKQDAEVSYIVQGDSEGGETSVLAYAQAAITRAILLPVEA